MQARSQKKVARSPSATSTTQIQASFRLALNVICHDVFKRRWILAHDFRKHLMLFIYEGLS